MFGLKPIKKVNCRLSFLSLMMKYDDEIEKQANYTRKVYLVCLKG